MRIPEFIHRHPSPPTPPHQPHPPSSFCLKIHSYSKAEAPPPPRPSLCFSFVSNLDVMKRSLHHIYFTTCHCHADTLPNTGHQNTGHQKQTGNLHLIFHPLTVLLVLFCSSKKVLTPKIGRLCFVIMNSILLNHLCVWICLFVHVLCLFVCSRPVKCLGSSRDQQTLL